MSLMTPLAARDRLRSEHRRQFGKCLPQGSNDAMAMRNQDTYPLAAAHLGKIDAAEQQSCDQEKRSFAKRASLNFVERRGDGARAVGPAPRFMNLLLRLLDADVFGLE